MVGCCRLGAQPASTQSPDRSASRISARLGALARIRPCIPGCRPTAGLAGRQSGVESREDRGSGTLVTPGTDQLPRGELAFNVAIADRQSAKCRWLWSDGRWVGITRLLAQYQESLVSHHCLWP